MCLVSLDAITFMVHGRSYMWTDLFSPFLPCKMQILFKVSKSQHLSVLIVFHNLLRRSPPRYYNKKLFYFHKYGKLSSPRPCWVILLCKFHKTYLKINMNLRHYVEWELWICLAVVQQNALMVCTVVFFCINKWSLT